MGAVRICFQTWNRLRSLSVHDAVDGSPTGT
jgi:hypothetical protein